VTNAATGHLGGDMAPGVGLDHGPSQPGTLSRHPDPLIVALARYVEALDARYPGGPAELPCALPRDRANMPAMPITELHGGRAS
jgi:hypothetical protein